MAHIAQQTNLVINVTEFLRFPGIGEYVEGGEMFEFAIYRAYKRGYVFDAIFAFEKGSSITYSKVSSIDIAKNPDNMDNIWMTVYINGEERYLSQNQAAKFDRILQYEQSRPNDAQ